MAMMTTNETTNMTMDPMMIFNPFLLRTSAANRRPKAVKYSNENLSFTGSGSSTNAAIIKVRHGGGDGDGDGNCDGN